MKFSFLKMAVLAGLAGMMGLASIALAQIGPEHDGHWNSPGLERQGLSIEAWPDQADGRAAGAFAVWYTYTPDGPDQAWLISDIFAPGEDTAPLYITAGAFPGVYVDPPIDQELEPIGELRIRPFGEDRLSVRYSIQVFPENCDPRPQPSPRPPFCAGQLTFERLSPAPAGAL